MTVGFKSCSGIYLYLAATTVKAAARPPHSTLAFRFGGYVAFGELGAFAEEELLHLLFHDFL